MANFKMSVMAQLLINDNFINYKCSKFKHIYFAINKTHLPWHPFIWWQKPLCIGEGTNKIFYLTKYSTDLVNNHSDNVKGNPQPPLHGILFMISSKESFICTIPQTGQDIPWPLLYQLWSNQSMGPPRGIDPWVDAVPLSYILHSHWYSALFYKSMTVKTKLKCLFMLLFCWIFWLFARVSLFCFS